jgi:TonB family protein
MTVVYMDHSQGDSSVKWAIALAAAIAVHLALLPAGVWLWPQAPDAPAASSRFEGMRVLAVLDDEPEDESPATPETSQYVSLPQPEREERPDDADFQDQYERRVERQTVNPDDALERQATTNAVSADSALTAPRAPAQQGAATTSSVPRGTPTRANAPAEPDTSEPGGQPDDTSAPDGTNSSTADGAASGAPGSSDSTQGLPEGTPGAPLDLSRFMPTPQTAASVVNPGARRNDALMLEEGDRTELNSLRSMYWSFFNRMQDQLTQHWNPNGVYSRHDPTYELYGRRDRYTVLSVTLNGDGSLRHAVVDRSSGLDFYDDECVRAFRAAAPFSNVPEGLKDENGHAQFTFGFMLNMTSRSARVRRLDGL